jgi:hypothetical protein
MGLIELRVPKSIETLVGRDQDRLLRPALRLAAKRRARELERERREALSHIRRYERKYGVPFAEFERKKLRKLDTLQAHEDYNDWFFWTGVLERAAQASSALKQMDTVE